MTLGPVQTNPPLIWTPNALIERHGHIDYVYGRWDRLFSCWRCENGRAAESVTPRWPLLDKDGELAMSNRKTVPLGEGEDESCHYDAVELQSYYGDGSYGLDDAAARFKNSDFSDTELFFRDYVELIPARTRRVSGAFGSWQWVILSMAWDSDLFVEFLREELPAHGPHFVGACLALAKADQMNRTDRAQLRQLLSCEKRAKLVATLVGPRLTGIVGLLDKLDIDACSQASCLNLFSIATDPAKAHILRQLPRINEAVLQWMTRLPSWICSVGLIDRLSETGDAEMRCLPELCRHIEDVWPDRRLPLARALRSSRDASHLKTVVQTWTNRLIERAPFPPAPFPGNANLQPITSVAMLRQEARRMCNCVSELAREVVLGKRYFYHWTGRQAATVSFMRLSSERWLLEEALGFGNAPLTGSTIARIEAAVRASARPGAGLSQAGLRGEDLRDPAGMGP